MKNMISLVTTCMLASILFVGCGSNTVVNQQNKVGKNLESKENEKKMKINIDDYNYIIPENEKGNPLHQEMEDSLKLNKEIEIGNEPVTIVLYGGFYYEQSMEFFTTMYIFNNTNKTIENLNFYYDENFEKIGGKNEGTYKFIYDPNEEHKIIPEKSIVPAIVKSENIVLKDPKKFYTASEIGSFEASNITIYYADSE